MMFGHTMPTTHLAHLQGTAIAVGEYNGVVSHVDGVYDISTVDTGRRTETVAFKVSGVGPDQIAEPYHVATLTVEPS